MSASMLTKLLSAGAVGAVIGVAMVATAAPEFNTSGNRFKPLTYAELSSEQRAFADKEIAIMLTSRYWGGQYVWYSHRQQALDAGLSPAFITAMAAGERPAKMSADEATVYDFCSQLLATRQVSDNNFKSMAGLVGERGIVDLVALMGQYTGLTMLFVVDRYPVPSGAPDEVNKPL
jgi:4-carboxymuconolactone decarboxylase